MAGPEEAPALPAVEVRPGEAELVQVLAELASFHRPPADF